MRPDVGNFALSADAKRGLSLQQMPVVWFQFMTRQPASRGEPSSGRKPKNAGTQGAGPPPSPVGSRVAEGPVSHWDNLRRRTRLLALLLFAVVLAVFLPVLRHTFICYDDNGYVTENLHVQQGLSWANIAWAFGTREVAYWHPLTWISHLIDGSIYGQKAWGHHLTSLLIHITNTLLVFVVLRKMTGAVWRSWVVAALFGLHPLHVESVAWVAERKDVLSTFFWLLALWSYAQWVGQSAAGRPRALVFYALSWLAFAGGLMSKPMVVTLPCVLLLLDYWPLQRWGWRNGGARPVSPGRLMLEKIPFFILSGVVSVLTVLAQTENHALLEMRKFPWSSRVANTLASYLGYLGKCFYPVKMAVFYPYPETPPVLPAIFGGIVVAAISLVGLIWVRRRPYLLIGWLIFLGTLVPVIGLIQVGGQAMADRYSYVPLLGVFIIVTWGVAEATGGWVHRSYLLVPSVVLMLAALALQTSRQLSYWRDSPTLFRHALAVTEHNWCAHLGLGYYLAPDPAHLDDAIAEYRESVKYAPRCVEAHFSLGAVLMRKPDGLAEAIAEFRSALRLDPGFSRAHAALGKALMLFPDRQSEAMAEYETAVRLDPDDVETRHTLADALAADPDRLTDAIAAYRAVLRLRPDRVEVHSNLGILLTQLPGRLPEAIAEYETVLRAKPGFAEAHNNLANALAQMAGREAETIAEYEAALRLRPDYYEAQFNLGLFLSGLPGRESAAIAHFEAALKIKPDLEPAREMIGRLRATMSR